MKQVITDGGRLSNHPNERLDCVVRGLAIAANMPYSEAHALFKAAGRRDRCRTRDTILKEIMNGFIKTGINGFKVCRAGDCGISVKRYITEHSQGRYLLGRRGHVFAVIDGVIHDLEGDIKPKSRVNRAYRFDDA